MRKPLGATFKVEDLGNHSAWSVLKLALLLVCRVDAFEDSEHPNFYEIRSFRTSYRVYIPPEADTVFLIAALPDALALAERRPLRLPA